MLTMSNPESHTIEGWARRAAELEMERDALLAVMVIAERHLALIAETGTVTPACKQAAERCAEALRGTASAADKPIRIASYGLGKITKADADYLTGASANVNEPL
jgi:hypothetical protein